MSYLSYLEKLLDGAEVEWKTLGWIGDVRMCKRIMKNQTSDTSEVPFFKIGTFGREPNSYISIDIFEEYKEKYSYPNTGDILISASGTIGRAVIFDGKEAYFQDSNIVWLENDESKVLNKYLFHYYKIAKWHISDGGVISRLYNDNIKKTSIPIPCPNDPKKSLAIQGEIVRILDAFTSLTAELTMRKKQYNYYRDRMLAFEEGAEVEWFSVEDLFCLKNGYTPLKANKNFWKDGTIPWFRMDDIRQNGKILDDSLQKISEYAVKGGGLFRANSMIFSTSATIGEHALITVPYLANQRFTNLSIKEEYIKKVDIKYLYYYGFLLEDWCKKNTTMSSFASVDMDGFKKFQIPIPYPNDPKKSLAEQSRIVSILDKFDALTNSISEGLPREINLRQKQYEYYRDQLLSFPKSLKVDT